MVDTRDEAMARAEKITGLCICHADYKNRGLIAPDCIYHDLVEDIADALQTARREGYAEGVEAAARELKTKADEWDRHDDPDYASAFRQCADIILALLTLSVPSGEGDGLAREDASGRTAARPPAVQGDACLCALAAAT